MQDAAVFSDSDELVVAEPAEPGGIAKPTREDRGCHGVGDPEVGDANAM
jgi:hypothetical protein